MASLNKICKRLGNQDVINNLSLDLSTYSITSLVGLSGCGKSTLLRIVAGLLPLDSGSVDINDTSQSVVFQDPRLLPWLTVEENLSLALPFRDAQKKKRISDALHKVRLDGIEHQFPRELSGGMAQRVAIARALMRDAKLLLMDEPFAALDVNTRSELQKMFVKLIKENQLNCLFVTHDLREAKLISDQLAVMQGGKIVTTFIKKPSGYPENMVPEVQKYFEMR